MLSKAKFRLYGNSVELGVAVLMLYVVKQKLKVITLLKDMAALRWV